jgi:hypothetical protein
MSKNRSDLINQALTNLGILVPGQSISDDLVTKMDGIVDPAVAMLAALEIYYVQDAGEAGPPTGGDIDDAAFLPLADYIANAACAAFNLAADTKMQALSLIAESKLITLSAPARTLRTLRVDPALRGRRYGWYRGTIN